MTDYSREILHVDDDPHITRLYGRLLSDRGFKTASLNDPTQAIDELIRSQRRLVLLDVDMPDVNGLTLLREIKGFDGGIQVIMLTGMVGLTSVLQSLRWGAEACFFKPLDSIDPLVETIGDAFRKVDRWWQTLETLAQERTVRTIPTVDSGALGDNCRVDLIGI